MTVGGRDAAGRRGRAETGGPSLSILEFSSMESLKESLKAGQGVTIIPEISVRDEIRQGRLAKLSWSDGPLESAILMIWHKDKWMSPTLRAFMDEARAVMGEQ